MKLAAYNPAQLRQIVQAWPAPSRSDWEIVQKAVPVLLDKIETLEAWNNRTCTWRVDDHGGTTDCGMALSWQEAVPDEVSCYYCPGCGGRVIQIERDVEEKL